MAYRPMEYRPTADAPPREVAWGELEGMIQRGEAGPGALLRVPVLTDDGWWTLDNFRVFHRLSPVPCAPGAHLAAELEGERRRREKQLRSAGFADEDAYRAFVAAFAAGGPGGEYFPAGRENHRREMFYARYLRAMGEPPLRPPPGCAAPGQAAPAQARYRVLCLPSFERPVAVRVERGAGGARLRAVELDGVDGRKPGALAREERRAVTVAEWEALERLLEAADYWALPTDDPERGGYDGTRWVLEGVRGGRHHVVDRWEPWPDRDPAVGAACLYLLRLSALAPAGDAIP